MSLNPIHAVHLRPVVLVLGPGPERIGGMATVVAQTLALDLGGRFVTEFLSNTFAPNGAESVWRRVRRHGGQVRRLRDTIRRLRPGIVHIHTCSGFSFFRSTVDMLVAGWLGCRVILHMHGAGFDTFHRGEPAWRRRLIAWSLARADRVVALSSGWAVKLRRISPRARIHVLENAVDVPQSPPRRRSNGPCRFLLLARMDQWKGIDDLLAASQSLRRSGVAFELTLAGPAGTAGDADALAGKIHEHGLLGFVQYRGSVQGCEKEEQFERADVFVQPSHQEGMPIALLEALACGLPVIATRVGAVPEVLEDQRQGLLIPPHRPDLIAGAMRTLALDGERRQAMSLAAHKLAVERFSTHRLRDDLAALYHDVLQALRRRSPTASRAIAWVDPLPADAS